MAMSADYRPISVERTPLFEGEAGAAGFAFYFSKAALFTIRVDGPRQKYYGMRLVPEVLLKPTAVFQGLNRPEYSDGYCYAGRPAEWWIDSKVKAPAPPDAVMLVFIKREFGLVVLDWEWRRADATNKGSPANWQKDFERMIWQTN